jgi:acetyl esterase/lipase
MVLLFAATSARAQAQTAASLSATLGTRYTVTPNITYLTASNYESKLDVYVPAAEGPHPTLLYFHGGGWNAGSKEASVLTFLPFLEKGWTVVNVEYRFTRVAPAPAAVEDCRCALRWVIQRAKDYKVDTSRIVTMGNSAGGLLALTTGMLPVSAGLDRACPGNNEELKVAAIINWYGVTDVNDLLDDANSRAFAITWVGSQPSREEVAKRVSPLNYARREWPPTITIQGDADPIVPYDQGVRLQKALDGAGVPNELVTIPKGAHGRFNAAEMEMAYARIWQFVERHVTKAAVSAR